MSCKKNATQQILIIFALVFTPGFGGHMVYAKERNLGPPEIKKITRLEHLYFSLRTYTKPIQVNPVEVSKTLSGFNTPEDVALAHFSSMLRSDFKAWLNAWDIPSQKEIIKRNTDMGRAPTFWTERWEKLFSPYKTFELLRRVDSDGFVLIEFQASGAIDKEKFTLEVVLKKDDIGKWAATNAHANDPVVLFWRHPEKPFETMTREPPSMD